MAKGKKTGGRTRGTPNKAKMDLLERMRQRVRSSTFDPLIEMAAIGYDKKEDPDRRLRALSECSKYVHPRLKAIEHSGALEIGVSGVLRVPTGPANEDEWEDGTDER